MNRIVIYRLGSLGDTVAALPCFHLIERAFPDSERLVLTNIPVSTKAAPLETVLVDGGFIQGTISYPLQLRDPVALYRLATKLRALNTETLIYLTRPRGIPQTFRDVAFFRLAGFTKIIGAPLTHDLQAHRILPDGQLERESRRLARTLGALGEIDLADRSWWDLRLTAGERSRARAALTSLGNVPFIAVNTGGKAEAKDWGEANWADTLTRLGTELPGRGLVFIGAREDGPRSARLGSRWVGGPVADLCGQVAPRVSAAVLERAEVFIGHDSGPLHLADAVGAPTVGLFGNYNAPKMWHPSGETTSIIHHMDGLSTITPLKATEATIRLIGDSASRAAQQA